jgi:hypothetical protein
MNHNVSAYVRIHETRCTVQNRVAGLLSVGIALYAVFGGVIYAEDAHGFLPNQMIVSTVPENGDLNPYGVAFVPQGFQSGAGPLRPGDILVSNFNNNMNLQGTGTTIVRVSPSGAVSTFFAGPPHPGGSTGLGLSTALAVLRHGFVIVGNVPSTDGTCGTATPGSLLVIDNAGNNIGAITDPNINGPWDMAMVDQGNHAIAFVSNVFAGTIVRLTLNVSPNGVTLAHVTEIASGYQQRCDPVAFVVGPTGLVYDPTLDVLYVASTEDNAVFAVHHAATRNSSGGTGTVIYTDAVHLHGPLHMAEAPNGHLLVSNSDVINPDPSQPSEIVEFTIQGQFVKQLNVDPAQGGSFGLAVNANWTNTFFAAVDDNTSTLTIWKFPQQEFHR